MFQKYLSPTSIIDSDHPAIVEYAEETVKDAGNDPVSQAVKLYYAVRDGIWYDPYYPFYLPEHYRASNILDSGRGFCISKAGLLCALGRACNIPSRVGFATVRNHLATRKLLEFIGSDRFVYHGYTEFYLNGKWIKATPTFNIELCEKHHVTPLDFNGKEDAILNIWNIMVLMRTSPSTTSWMNGKKHMAKIASANGSKTLKKPEPSIQINGILILKPGFFSRL